MDVKTILSRHSAVFTAPPQRVPCRTAVDGPLLGNGDLGACLGGPPECLRFWLAKNDFWKLTGQYNDGPRHLGSVALRIPQLQGASYRVEQRLWDATTVATFHQGETSLTLTAWVAATQNTLFVELAVTGNPLAVEIELAPARHPETETATGATSGCHWWTRKLPSRPPLQVEAACALAIHGAEGLAFRLEPGRPVVLAVGVQSRFKSDDYLNAAISLTAGDAAALRTPHTAWWQEFWSRSLVELGDSVLEQRYYLSQYVMGSCCRDREFPPCIFGTWVTTDEPEWGGDYHLNYNYQAPFYGLYSSNHLEQAMVYHAPILDFMERGRWFCREILGIRGVYYPVGIGPKGSDTTQYHPQNEYCVSKEYEKESLFYGQKSNAAYCVVNLAAHWYHSYDPAYGAAIYPFVREVADFWEDYLRFEDGRYVIYTDAIHECSGPDFNPILSLGLTRMVFKLVIDLGAELGLDSERHATWRHILAHLSDFPTYERDGKTVFRLSERGMEANPGNTLAIQHIYPAGVIGLDSPPRLLEVARNTIDALNAWRDSNGMNSFYPCAARVGYDGERLLAQLRAMIQEIGQPNGFIRDNPHGIENCSLVPNTLNEMLLQSHEGVLRLFPVWPRNRDAGFQNLRAAGAFRVSAECRGGVIGPVRLVSERGRPVTLQSPWPGQPVRLRRNGRAAETLTGDRLRFATAPGETLDLSPVIPR